MKIGIIVITHGQIAEELVKATETIIKEKSGVYPISVLQSDIPHYKKILEETILKASQGKGILLLSDMFGGTPSNLCLSFLKKGEIELVTGVNLPMLVKLTTLSEDLNVSQVAQFILEYGQRHITQATKILEKIQ